eukprot:CAMPEP_0116914606 /NCGR_PEP_ID=MMETSP0467-20121206/17428_1 /TAXON_ID=283647 /ORGANISM="Mesodinium pulex, Strain SPMC105" /LENGTH=177 /DNA_ID=CAMNT_0004591101 /DNA_START=213 /DNA_END=746 /DNA_ORIENTATION=-
MCALDLAHLVDVEEGGHHETHVDHDCVAEDVHDGGDVIRDDAAQLAHDVDGHTAPADLPHAHAVDGFVVVALQHQNQHVAHGEQVLRHVHDVGGHQSDDADQFDRTDVVHTCEQTRGRGFQLDQLPKDSYRELQHATNPVGDLHKHESLPAFVIDAFANKLNPRLRALIKDDKRKRT